MEVKTFSDFQNQVKSDIVFIRQKTIVELGENAPANSLLPLIKIYQIARSLCYSVWFKERKKLKILVQSYIFFFNPFTQYKGQKNPIYFYCVLWLQVEQVTKPGKSYVVLGQSWCATSVLGSQVFGQASIESCVQRGTNIRIFKYIEIYLVNYLL